MPAHLDVFCRKRLSPLTSADLSRALEQVVDIYTVAEGFGIEDEAIVDAALSALTIEGDDSFFEIRYRPPELRPIQLELISDPARVRETAREVTERVDPAYAEGAKLVHEHLSSVVEIASFELGFPMLEDMGVVIAGQLAEQLANTGNGLIQDQNDDWWSVDADGIPHVIVGPKTRKG